jgi:hypothetical protein
MAGIIAFASSGEVALVAATPKSVLQIKAPANQRIIIRSLRFLGKAAAGGTDTPIKVKMTRNSATFGTFTAMTPGKQNPSNGETLQGTYGQNASVEPTSPADSGLWWEVQPQSGVEELLPIDQWIEVPGGQSVQFECTSIATPTILIVATVEE